MACWQSMDLRWVSKYHCAHRMANSGCTRSAIPIPSASDNRHVATYHSGATALKSLRPRIGIASISAVLELTEEMRQERMVNRQPTRIVNEIFRCCIGAGRRSVDKYVIPRLIAVRLCLVLGIPRVVCLAGLIAVNDDSAIAVTSMPNQLPDFENRLRRTVDCNHCRNRLQSKNGRTFV